MRIKYIIPFALATEDIARRAEQVVESALAPETSVECVSVRNHPTTLRSHYHEAIVEMYVAEAGLRAEAEGFDAVVMDTVSDSGLAVLRSRLSIPVVGPGMVSYAVANLVGKRFSILAYLEEHRFFYEKTLAAYGCAGRCASIRVAGMEPNYAALFGDEPEAEFMKLAAAAEAAIHEDGADTVVLGSTTMHQAGVYLSDRLAAPVINPGPIALKVAEAFVQLGLSHSKIAYRSPDELEDEKWFSLSGRDDS